MQRVRLGVLGGAFDPPHLAHVAMARAALAQAALDALHVLPTGQAWHKSRSLSDAHHRLAMARLAFEPFAVVDARELERAGATYTVDTLEALQWEFAQADLRLFIGADQAAAFTRWHRWQDILRAAIVFVAHREDTIGLIGGPDAIESLRHATHLAGLPPERIQALQMPAMDISATDIRQRVACGLDIRHLVPEAVAGYIAQHHLYQTA